MMMVRATPRPMKSRRSTSATGSATSTVPPTTQAVQTSVRSSTETKIGSANTVAKLASPTNPRTSPKRDTFETERWMISHSG